MKKINFTPRKKGNKESFIGNGLLRGLRRQGFRLLESHSRLAHA